MITGESITDQQIRELLWSADPITERETRAICSSALNSQCHESRRIEARARCAEILNARAKESK